MNAATEMTCDHWWWRPGWRLGRSFYTWHITFSRNPEVCGLVGHYASAIQKFQTLDPVSPDGLHLTIQGIGFTDEVSRSGVDQIVAATATSCSKLAPFRARIGPAEVDTETVHMPVNPATSIIDLRIALREGIGDVWGTDNVPESMEGFRPHVTLAYSNGVAAIREIGSAIRTCDLAAAETLVSTVSLIELNRDRKRYEWVEIAKINIGQ